MAKKMSGKKGGKKDCNAGAGGGKYAGKVKASGGKKLGY